MKKYISAFLAVCMALGIAGCSLESGGGSQSAASSEPAAAGEVSGDTAAEPVGEYHIGIATGTVAQSEDELRGAEAFIEEYKLVEDGGIVRHVTYPDNFMQEQETTIAQFVSLADDPLMKAIVVNQAVPGMVAAFQKIRQTRPDILLIAGPPQEDPNITSEAADLVVDADNINRGYLMVLGAQKLGAKTFVHISFPRHMSIDLLSRRRAIMEEACKDLGITFVNETSPDPMSDVGIPGAQQFILEKMPAWVEKYGKDTAFFCTNDAQTEPLLKRVAELGAIFVEPDLPSPIMGYPGAFGIDLKSEAGNWPAILSKVEEVVIEKGGSERMGTWAYSFNYTTTLALSELARRTLEGEAKLDSFDDLMACYAKYTPGADWNGSYYSDTEGNEKTNYVLMYQDTYVFGKGYLGQTKETIPEKYRKLK